jgi:uncharacterized protein (DUF849 family)
MLKACVNGIRLPGTHPALPVTPEQLATAAGAVARSGAAAVHLHVKDDDGVDTLDGARLAAVLEAVRSRLPGMPVGVTTGAWAAPEPADRVEAIASWTVLPDFASVNWHEPGTEEVAAVLLSRGVAVEAGLWHAEGIRAWHGSPLRRHCLRVLVELSAGPVAASTEERAERRLVALGVDSDGRTSDGVPVLLHGKDRSAWPALRYAVLRGLDTRMGLEDCSLLPDESPAPDNAALIDAARALGAR